MGDAAMGDRTTSRRPESQMMSRAHDPQQTEGAIKVPLYQTSTFEFATAEDGARAFAAFAGDETMSGAGGYIYSRLDNPNLRVAEERLRRWDGAERALLFGSGMSAISTTLLAYLRPGDVLVHSHPLYGCTDYVVRSFLPEFGITVIGLSADMGRSEVDAAIDRSGDGRLGMIFVETPANPTLDLFDVSMLAEITRERGDGDRRPPLVVDNTFLGPMWQHPLDHGADIVLYSATKFIGGHSDLIAGAVLGDTATLAPIAGLRAELGTMASPETAWLITRSLETLQVRTTRQAENTQRVSEFLSGHPAVRNLRSLDRLEPGTDQHEIYKRQCLGAGALVAFEFAGGREEAFRFLNALSLIKLAVSLGSTESLAEHPAAMTHSGVDPAVRAQLGITEGLVRLSIGVEAADDLIADLAQALDHAVA